MSVCVLMCMSAREVACVQEQQLHAAQRSMHHDDPTKAHRLTVDCKADTQALRHSPWEGTKVVGIRHCQGACLTRLH